ncbi:MAG TPA: diaminopimelate epimerase [Candidatus Dormibacteraeota bacterium]|nr:diaminopimelate epimerase [Candidatus Dormibacteraeota bacterium]
MKIPFTKLHGAKNDFLLTFSEDAPAGDLPAVAVAICDRYTGAGADGWMLVDRAAGADFDASIRLFNSDGSEPELSGNGTRCAGALLLRDQNAGSVRIRTGAGIKHLRLISRQGLEYLFEMNMGHVRVNELSAIVQERDTVIIDVGNPQCAIPVEHFDFDWRAVGKAVENDGRFPNRTNVSFVRPVDRHTIDVRFWERGAGETNSSGTGSTGAAMAAIARGFAESPVTVQTPAGALTLRFEDSVFLTGPAEFIAEGIYFYGGKR